MMEGGEPALGCSAEPRPLVAHPSTQLVIRGRGVEWGTRPGVAGAGEMGQSLPGSCFRRGEHLPGGLVQAVPWSGWWCRAFAGAGQVGAEDAGVTLPGLPARHWPHTGGDLPAPSIAKPGGLRPVPFVRLLRTSAGPWRASGESGSGTAGGRRRATVTRRLCGKRAEQRDRAQTCLADH